MMKGRVGSKNPDFIYTLNRTETSIMGPLQNELNDQTGCPSCVPSASPEPSPNSPHPIARVAVHQLASRCKTRPTGYSVLIAILYCS